MFTVSGAKPRLNQPSCNVGCQRLALSVSVVCMVGDLLDQGRNKAESGAVLQSSSMDVKLDKYAKNVVKS